MPDHSETPVLRQKIGVMKTQFSDRGHTPQKVLRQSIAKSGRTNWGLEITVPSCQEQKTDLNSLIDRASNGVLRLYLSGPSGAFGLAIVDGAFLAAMVEQLTTGRVMPGAAVDRSATRTDAMIMAEVVDQILIEFDSALGDAPALPPIKGFRFLSVLEDAHAVKMAFENVAYRQFALTLDIGRGAKAADFSLIFPYDPPMARDHLTREFKAWNRKWHQHVLGVEAPLQAILHRFTTPLSEMSELAVGTVIGLPKSRIGDVALVGLDHKCVATGKLGQANGCRAIRINADAGLNTIDAATALAADQTNSSNSDAAAPAAAPANVAALAADAPTR